MWFGGIELYVLVADWEKWEIAALAFEEIIHHLNGEAESKHDWALEISLENPDKCIQTSILQMICKVLKECG